MLPGERFKGWIDSLATAWKDRLRGWMASWVDKGFTALFEGAEPITQDMMRDSITRIANIKGIPEDYKKALLDSLSHADWQRTSSGYFWYLFGILPSILSSGQPFANLVNYDVELLTRTLRLDPLTFINLKRRFPGKYDSLVLDIQEQGWSDERIAALEDATLFYPAPQDLVNWQAREVFEPAMITKYGLDDEFGGIDLEPFRKAGMTDEQSLNYWRAHWEHASWNQVVEMLHRGLMTEPEVWDWFRLVEIPPYWRQKLIDSAYNIPTRVDVRRFYDMRTIDETRLREIYAAQGYSGKNLDDYVLWTKIYVELPDLLARWKNGWITLAEVRDRLIAAGMKPDAADELIQTKVKSVEPASTAEGKELTKTEIYKGVKMGVISYDEGIDLIMQLDYTYDQADYLLITNVAVLEGSPDTYPEFLNMTQKYRKAAGLEGKPVPYALQQAAKELVQATKERDDLKRRLDEERKQMVDIEPLPEPAASKIKELQVALNRAESEVARLQADYNGALAEWKHGA